MNKVEKLSLDLPLTLFTSNRILQHELTRFMPIYLTYGFIPSWLFTKDLRWLAALRNP